MRGGGADALRVAGGATGALGVMAVGAEEVPARVFPFSVLGTFPFTGEAPGEFVLTKRCSRGS